MPGESTMSFHPVIISCQVTLGLGLAHGVVGLRHLAVHGALQIFAEKPGILVPCDIYIPGAQTYSNISTIIWVFPKIWENPQIIHVNRVFHYKPFILGYPYSWKHPYVNHVYQPCHMKRNSMIWRQPPSPPSDVE